MAADPNNIAAMLEAWRERGVDRVDPIGFHRIDALQRRAAVHDGEVRRLLDARLAALIEVYADGLNQAATRVDAATRAPARGAMGELVDYIACQAAQCEGIEIANEAAASASFPELGVLEDFKTIWSRVRVESQLRDTMQAAPADAGPLNSGRLVHRSLNLMRELSPGYLQQFLSYVDALSWMERMNGDGAMAFEEVPRPGAGGKRAPRPRKRRD
ncbi:DUF2894 domain-containing protein [Lysobacter sp. CA199]|uniref:DUF2894 domain-containing protein n=1 Tax=Lysobacter sp. CA199 TaxID=3455608 RepID=UPI003F8D3335